MSADAWITLGVMLGMIVGLVSGRISPPVGVLGATGLLYLLGVIEADEAFSGFSNIAPITVAGLYVLAEGISKTGALRPILRVTLGTVSGTRTAVARLVAPTAAASAFVANTPIVAMLLPEVTRWSDTRGRSASKYLIPLSYASILGGTLTVIGTSTNLLVSGLIEESGGEPFSLFEMIKVSGPVALVGLLVIIAVGAPLLPPRRRPRHASDDSDRPFTVAMRVVPGGPLDGRSVEAADLRHLEGVFLAEIRRQDRNIAPVAPEQTLRADDELVFVGQVDQIVDLQGRRGLEPASGDPLRDLPAEATNAFFEAVIGAASPLVGNTLAGIGFRGRYQAAVVGIHRAGEAVHAKLGDVPLRAGDTLLLLAGRDFRNRWRERTDFLLVSRLDGPDLRASAKAPIAALALALVALLPVFDVMTVTRATVLAAGVLVLARVLSPREARDAVDLNVVLMIGGAFGLGAAVQSSGLAETIADGLLDATSSFGDFGVVLGLLLSTMILTELVTNTAAAALVFPTAVTVAADSGIDVRITLIGVAVAASCSFLTPIGYQTNTMVYGPGGYRFTDYLRLGVPLSIIVIIGVSAMVTVLG
ncbi:MAG: SLC13 family permease [Acidimicrobiia bacterium]|nr:SLC13 family permease [Acidimicrobiia bacterium]MDH5236755.1 SLC13 family permease [Acidimicrobiia bacterium]